MKQKEKVIVKVKNPNTTNKRIKARKEAHSGLVLSGKAKTHQSSIEANTGTEDREGSNVTNPVARLKEFLKKIAENQRKK